MATTYLSPIGNEPQSDANGAPLNGGKIYTYQAGTTTPIATYADNTGSVAQANPIVLNAQGLPASPIWLPAGQAVKLVIQDANGVTLRTVDNVVGVNDPSGASTADQWVIYQGSPQYVSATSFSLAGDQTAAFHVGRRVRAVNSGGTVYGAITAASYNSGTGRTTVTVSNDSAILDSGLSQVSYALLSAVNNSLPRYPAFSAFLSASQSLANSTFVKLGISAEDFDTAGAYDNITNYRFQPAVAGYYQISGGARFGGTGLSDVALAVYKNGAIYKRLGGLTASSTSVQVAGSTLVYLNGTTDYVELFGFTSATSGNLATGGPEYSFFQGAFVRGA